MWLNIIKSSNKDDFAFATLIFLPIYLWGIAQVVLLFTQNTFFLLAVVMLFGIVLLFFMKNIRKYSSKYAYKYRLKTILKNRKTKYATYKSIIEYYPIFDNEKLDDIVNSFPNEFLEKKDSERQRGIKLISEEINEE